ncbi:FecR domain-containing protein [Pedobacter sp. MC2016-14]|uniref:FecR family protein n=1 Tax=Pedobacter sp. MC2016-14 TaxID=2897327 RepID=UPI001E2A7CC4|nr:FecR domain-containing protein [Pedobacter sp. MC2016-14]MCD0488575.1 FecR domain-containing protein [Pedobacter sp. MC2016-14]
MNKQLIYLYHRYIEGTCTPEEQEQFLALIAAKESVPQVSELLDDTWNSFQTDEQTFPQADDILQKILAEPEKAVVKKISWYRYTAAAAILIVLGTWLYTLFPKDQQQTEDNNIAAIVPGTNKATLTLANGKVIALDNTTSGKLAQQSGVQIVKTKDGQLVYQLTSADQETAASPEFYNTISTPAGGQYQVNLPDGTKIWLNAASSITYPTRFAGATRKIRLSGEAYFEVSKDKAHPFMVTTDKQEIKVLGTHFNVNSYVDEQSTKTTLLEGSVQVSALKTKQTSILKPGEQAVLINNSMNVSTVETDEAIAWKNGYFQFNESNLASIMRQISRWYNIAVVFEGKSPDDLFHVKIPRNLSLPEVLKIFEMNGINFKIEGRTLIVKS